MGEWGRVLNPQSLMASSQNGPHPLHHKWGFILLFDQQWKHVYCLCFTIGHPWDKLHLILWIFWHILIGLMKVSCFMLSYVLCLSLFSSVKVFELNLVAIKLVQEEALSRLLWLYQAAPRKSPLFQVLIICTSVIFLSIHFHIIW